MADTDIEWADKVWNFLVGCSRETADPALPSGCDHCYAIREVARERCEQHKGLTKIRPKDAKRPGPDWNGKVRFVEHKLEEPLHWRDPKRIFVNSVSDLFHKQVPFDVIDRAFAIMMASPQHTFLVLTKRDMRPWFEGAEERVRAAAEQLAAQKQWCHDHEDRPWPLDNVHVGISAEHQAAADLRIPWLLEVPAAVRWVSYEPALGPLELQQNLPGERILRWHHPMIAMLNWLVVGGESGPGARQFHVDWARQIVRACRKAKVPVFVKQLGAFVVDRNDAHFNYMGEDFEDGWPDSITPDDVIDDPNGCREQYQGAPVRIRLRDRKGKDMAQWPRDLRVREFPGARP